VEGRFATSSEENGVRRTSGALNGFEVAELRFPPRFVQAPFEPESPYLAVVLDGGLEKSFRFGTLSLAPGKALTMPVGATHGARFGPTGARVVIVRARSAERAAAGCLDRLVELRGQRLGWLAWRLAGELHADDTAAPLAAEGLACELLAAAGRERRGERATGRPPAWLVAVEELLHARIGDCIGLGELAEAVGVHPAHVARVFRARHGVSVGDYSRGLRLAWAATEVARTDTSLAVIAARAGFADQSHFTRLFKRSVGLTPARYRAETQRARHGSTDEAGTSNRS
jgi:AraC family transcriptional regulator